MTRLVKNTTSKIKNNLRLEKFLTITKYFSLCLFFVLGFILFALPLPAFSKQSAFTDFEKKDFAISEEENLLIIEKTDWFYNRGEYLKAVKQINVGIELYQKNYLFQLSQNQLEENKNESAVPDNIKLTGEASYFSWINSSKKRYEIIPLKLYEKMILNLTLHPEVFSTRINSLIEEIFQQEKQSLENQRKIFIEKNQQKKLDLIVEKIYKIEQSKNQLLEVSTGKKNVEDVRKEILIEENFKKAQFIKALMISLYFLILLGIIILIFILQKNHKRILLAQEHFETTMKVVSILSSNSFQEDSELKKLSDLKSENVIEEFFNEENEKENPRRKFLTLQNKCMELGEKIDKVTGRKRNSKKVSELVFKLCKSMGLDDKLSLVYYCAAMVYDAGFLAVSKDVLQGEHLTIKERYEVRSHVQKAGQYFGFVPENLRRIFLDAAEFHHENFNGKGYLSGVSGTKIPLIARFIRVAESYISLINVRSYRQIMDAESAIAELKRSRGIYDEKILTHLEQIV